MNILDILQLETALGLHGQNDREYNSFPSNIGVHMTSYSPAGTIHIQMTSLTPRETIPSSGHERWLFLDCPPLQTAQIY